MEYVSWRIFIDTELSQQARKIPSRNSLHRFKSPSVHLNRMSSDPFQCCFLSFWNSAREAPPTKRKSRIYLKKKKIYFIYIWMSPWSVIFWSALTMWTKSVKFSIAKTNNTDLQNKLRQPQGNSLNNYIEWVSRQTQKQFCM